jgi:hypothetical protein
VRGLTQDHVPSTSGEHPSDSVGASFYYEGEKNATCVSPLFASQLPTQPTDELCNLPRSLRSPRQIFFGVIGGAPTNLLTYDPMAQSNGYLSDFIWGGLVGGSIDYDFRGVDVRMLESIERRPGVALDRDTQGKDLQFACWFPLPTPRLCPSHTPFCECATGDPASPLCDPANAKRQIAAKAYPALRQLAVARAVGDNAVVWSTCADTDAKLLDPSKGDPRLYGYRPIMSMLVDRMAGVLAK